MFFERKISVLPLKKTSILGFHYFVSREREIQSDRQCMHLHLSIYWLRRKIRFVFSFLSFSLGSSSSRVRDVNWESGEKNKNINTTSCRSGWIPVCCNLDFMLNSDYACIRTQKLQATTTNLLQVYNRNNFWMCIFVFFNQETTCIQRK